MAYIKMLPYTEIWDDDDDDECLMIIRIISSITILREYLPPQYFIKYFNGIEANWIKLFKN